MQLLTGGGGSSYTTETFPLGLRITNGNDQQATNVKATVQLPNNTAIVSMPAGVTCTSNGGSAACTLGSIDAGRTETLMLDLRSTQSGMRDYEATVSADQYDFDEANNKSNNVSLNLAVATADLVTTCTAPASVTQGASVTVQCNVINNGPRTATGAVIQTADLPAMLTFASAANGCSLSGARVTCPPDTLPSGATKTFSMTLNAVSTGTASIAASIDADQDDPVVSNSLGTASITVSAPPPPPPPPPAKSGGGSLSMWLLLALALLAAGGRSGARRVTNSS